MNLPSFEIGVAIFMVAFSIAFLVWSSRHAAASEERMLHMLTRAGADPAFSGHDDTWAILQVARGRCRGCQSEDLCDRWLSGNVKRENSFCPNVQMFRILKAVTRRIAASIDSDRHAKATTLTPGSRNVVRIGVDRDASVRLTPSIHSPISAVL